MQDHDLDASNLDTVREPHRRSRLFLEDDPSMSVEDDAAMSISPSVIKRTFSASAVFLFLFVVLAGVGGALAWRSYGDQATDMIRAWALPGTTSNPTAPPEGFAELQQQLKSIAIDLAAVKHSLEQQSAANKDQLTRIQEQIAQQSIALQGNQAGAESKAFIVTSSRQASPRSQTCATPGTAFGPRIVQGDPITTKAVTPGAASLKVRHLQHRARAWEPRYTPSVAARNPQ
jgi:hypothetical protein